MKKRLTDEALMTCPTLDEIREDVSRLEFTDDDLKAFDALEKELSSMDLDFLLR